VKWFYLWQLRRANTALSEALDAMPDGWNEDPEWYVDEIIAWAKAHIRVSRLLVKLSK